MIAAPERFPGLDEIVVAGHSSGGQFAQRYGLVGRPTGGAPELARYVVVRVL